jgi:GTP pyrophosphokinase
MPKNKQIDKAKETLEIFAPIAHRLGIHALKWELEDLAFQALHPRKYTEIKGLVNQQREERETYVDKAGEYLRRELEALGIEAEISGRAKHFYSIYSKMTKKGREFNEIYDLTAMRVQVGLGEGLLRRGRRHPLAVEAAARAVQGLHRDAQVQHVPVAAHDGHRARGAAAGDPDPHARDARHGRVRRRRALDLQADKNGRNGARPRPDGEQKLKWLRHMLDWQQDLQDPKEFMETLKVDLFDEEVFVFTPKGEVKSLAAGATPLDFAYEVHTEIGHRCVGARVNGKIVPLHYELKSGDIVEILTANRSAARRATGSRGQDHPRAQQDPAVVQGRVARGHRAHRPRLLQEHLNKRGLPRRRSPARRCSPTSSARWASARPRTSTSRSAARRSRRRSSSTRSSSASSRARPPEGEHDDGRGPRRHPRERRQPTRSKRPQYGIRVEGVEDVMLRWPSAATRSRRPITGYISLGARHHDPPRGLPERRDVRKDPERFVSVSWEGDHETAFKVEIEVDAYDPHAAARGAVATFAGVGPSTSSRPAASCRRRWSRNGSCRGRRHPHAQVDDHPPAQHRLGLRRLPRHPVGLTLP